MRVTNDVTAAPPRTTLTHGLASTSDGPVSVPGRSAVRPPYRNAPPVSSLRCRELDRVETLTSAWSGRAVDGLDTVERQVARAVHAHSR